MKLNFPTNTLSKLKSIFATGSPKKKLAITCTLALLVLVLLYSGYMAFAQINDKNSKSSDELTIYLKQIEKSITLPQGEIPSLATVNDADKLRNDTGNKFFTNAQSGDKLIIFSAAKKVILYRPGEKKIIEYSSLSLEPPKNFAATPTSESNQEENKPLSAKIVILNSTTTAGLAKKYEALLKEKFPNIEVTSTGNSQIDQLDKTIVIDLTENKKEDADKIAKEMQIEQSSLPEGETKPDADFLIILGNDKTSL